MADSGLFGSPKTTSRRPGRPTRPSRVIVDPDVKDLKVLGKGTYGCVVKPVKKCKDDRINQLIKEEEDSGKKYVSKIIKDFGDPDDIKTIVKDTINFNEIARRAGSTAERTNDKATNDYGMEMYECELEKPVQIPKCGKKLSDQSLILTELGNLDSDEIIGIKRDELIRDLSSITVDEIKRAIFSNLININQLHAIGWVNLDIKLPNLLPNFEKPFSFKIIDYDLFNETKSKIALQYYEADYFFPPEYCAYGKLLMERRRSTPTSTEILRWLEQNQERLTKFLNRTQNKAVVRKMSKLVYDVDPFIQADNDAAWGEVYRQNLASIINMHNAVINRTDKSVLDVKEYKEFLASVDYFMYSVAMYTFVYELSNIRPASEISEWDEILEKISVYFHPIYDNRIESINNFKRTQSF